MKIFIRTIVFTFLVFELISCTRKAAENSHVQLKLPNSNQLVKKLSDQATGFPSDKKLCLAVNVNGPEIEKTPFGCGPTMGISKGFVFADENPTITFEVPKGLSRTFELFYYAQKLSDACPNFSDPGLDASKIYRVGVLENVNLTQSEETVNIAISYPGDSQNIVATIPLPVTCGKSDSPNTTGKSENLVNFAPTLMQSASGIKIKASLSAATVVTQVSSDNSVRIKSRIKFNP